MVAQTIEDMDYYLKYNWFIINNYIIVIIYNYYYEKGNKFLFVWNKRYVYIGYEGKYIIS